MTTATETYRYGKLHIRYFDVDVATVRVGNTVYFPMRALCQTMGIGHQSQFERLRGDDRFTDALRTLPVPTPKGVHDAVCIHKRGCSVWLSSIDPSKCAITARGTIERFQEELFAAADRFLFGDTSPAPGSLVSGTLFLGACPNCGHRLVVDFTESGAHLREDSD
jgi:sarcosine oxidase delta subunit